MSKVKDFKQIEIISDWTYSTTYKGSVKYLSNHTQRIRDETALLIHLTEDQKHKINHIMVKTTDDEIPLTKLGRDNPILHYGEVYLYEDDLGD